MFTTGHHEYLYLALALYGVAGILAFARIKSGARAVVVPAVMLHGAWLLGRGWLGGVFIANPVVEGPFFMPFCITAIALGMGIYNKSGKWATVLAVGIFFTVLSAFYAKGMIPPTPKKISFWAILFFVSESAAHACFHISTVLAVAALFRMGKEGEYLSFVIWGIVAYTVSQVTGAVWSYLGWGNTFNWSPRHLSSASIWLLYLAILHVRFVSGWGRRREAFLVTAAGGYVLFSTFGHYLKEMTFPRIGG